MRGQAREWLVGGRGGVLLQPPPVDMTFTVVTTGSNQTLTINELRTVIGETVNVKWGDGQSDNYTSTGVSGNTRTHLYAVAGSYTVTIDKPTLITHFDIRDAKVTQLLGAEVSKMRELRNFRILSVPSTALQWTVSASEPMFRHCQYMQIELQDNLNWSVSGNCPPINDVLNLRGLPGVTWVIDANNPVPFETERLTIRDCPGITYVSSMENVPDLITVRIENGWTQTQVDAWLRDVYAGFPNRSVTGGTIDLLGSGNAAPSGTLQAACPPTNGKEYAYELVNDTCNIAANHWTSIDLA